MDSEKDEVSDTRTATERTRNPPEASEPSLDSSESSSGVRGSKRRGKAAMTPPVSTTGASSRVLRARGFASDTSADVKNSRHDERPVSLHGRRRTPVGSRCKNTPATQNALKKPTAKQASKNTPGPQRSKSTSIKGKRRPSTSASHTTPAAACKPETEIEASSCGEESGDVKGSNDNVADSDTAPNKGPLFREDPRDLKQRRMLSLPKKENTKRSTTKQVKKEESEKEEEENEIKKEESTEAVVQTEDRVDNNTERPSRKRGRRQKDDKAPRQPKRRKKPPVQYVRCEIEGCGTVLAHPRYLQHHIKYQHLLKKKYVCDHPSCGRLFRLQKQLLRHAKHHTDQRDYICEYCARAFKSSHNLAVHRMIHTGEKPIQCEICGFTCRQKASLNWHMKKHDAEASYQFSCSICGKKFEKKDSVVAHKAKSHPEVLIAEALAANGGSVISSPTSVPESVLVLTQPHQPSVSQENQEEVSDTLTLLQQVVLPLTSQTPVDVSQGQFFDLPTHHMVQAGHQQQAPALLHLTAASPAAISTINHPQLNQLPTLAASTVTSMTTLDSQSSLLTLSPITTLPPTVTLAPQQALQWSREADEVAQIPGEGELWDRVIVGGGREDVGEIVWEREGERQIMLQCTEAHGDSLM